MKHIVAGVSSGYIMVSYNNDVVRVGWRPRPDVFRLLENRPAHTSSDQPSELRRRRALIGIDVDSMCLPKTCSPASMLYSFEWASHIFGLESISHL